MRRSSISLLAVVLLGTTLSVGSTSDFTTIAASGVSVYADEILELVADVTLRATFPQNEIDLARENTKQMLIQQRAQPNFLASERMANAHRCRRRQPERHRINTRQHHFAGDQAEIGACHRDTT